MFKNKLNRDLAKFSFLLNIRLTYIKLNKNLINRRKHYDVAWRTAFDSCAKVREQDFLR